MTQADWPLRLRTSSPADDEDRAVLVRLADGELMLEDLYDRYKTMAYSIAYRITNDASLAEDVVQDAFLGAWRNAARYVEGAAASRRGFCRSSTIEPSMPSDEDARRPSCPTLSCRLPTR